MQRIVPIGAALAVVGAIAGLTTVASPAQAASVAFSAPRIVAHVDRPAGLVREKVALSRPRIVAHFNRPAGQVPESVVVEPDGSADVGLILSRQVAHVTPSGQIKVLATMPMPADGGVNTPGTGVPNVTGIERTCDGTIYFLYSAGDHKLTGLWRLRPGGSPNPIAAFPARELPQRADTG